MAMSIREIRDRNAKARASFARAKRQKYALVAFNIDNLETLRAICKALKKFKAPAMVEVSKNEVEFLGLENIRDIVNNYREEYGIELYLNLDHSPSVRDAKMAIDEGYEFIHIDISQSKKDASLAEIISATREVTEYAKFTGAIVESEPHYFGGASNKFNTEINYEEIEKHFTRPSDAENFVLSTGIDTYAVAIGNLHGSYPVPKILDIELLKEINKTVKCNLSLHGGSGTPNKFYKEAIKNGINKVNINSDIRIAYRTALEEVLRENPEEFAVIKLMDKVEKALEKVIEEKLIVMGAKNKAII